MMKLDTDMGRGIMGRRRSFVVWFRG